MAGVVVVRKRDVDDRRVEQAEKGAARRGDERLDPAWAPWTFTSGIGIGLAFPILGAAAVAHVDPARFGTACALSSTFRQVGAVVGTAAVVAIVGDPASIADGMARADRAYLAASLVALCAGLVAAGLRRRAPARGGGRARRAIPGGLSAPWAVKVQWRPPSPGDKDSGYP